MEPSSGVDGQRCSRCDIPPLEGQTFAKCGACKRVRYCSVECQRIDWKDGHKRSCVPAASIVDSFWAFVERSWGKDRALTEAEYRGMKIWTNRLTGVLNFRDGGVWKRPGPDPAANRRLAVAFAFDRLLAVGRGVRLARTLGGRRAIHGGKIAYVVEAVSEKTEPTRRYRVELADGTGTLVATPAEIHMLPLSDPRHWKHAEEFSDDPDDVPPPGTDAEAAWRERQYIPVTEGYKWEHRGVDGTWKEYSSPIQYLLETMYDMGSQHCLYTPGAPHCEGRLYGSPGMLSTDANDALAGLPWFMNPHDASTRQVVFRELRMLRKTRPSAGSPFLNAPLMSERDLFTGMRRPVRRSGPLPPPENDYCHERNVRGPEYHYRDDGDNIGTFCGLCRSTRGPFVRTDCCGGWVCDTEDEDERGGGEREGQCARNHRYHTICGYHHAEGHGCDWKDCDICIQSFHPYDYAVKATSMAVAGTSSRYNFDNNVRHDLDPKEAVFPVCGKCAEPVDTTEETTKTLSMRRSLGEGKTLCKYHGGGFGKIMMA